MKIEGVIRTTLQSIRQSGVQGKNEMRDLESMIRVVIRHWTGERNGVDDRHVRDVPFGAQVPSETDNGRV